MAPRSDVWKNFVKVNASSAKCKECGNVVKTSGNTVNLWNHLARKHGISKQAKKSAGGNESTSVVGEDDQIDPDDPVAVVGGAGNNEVQRPPTPTASASGGIPAANPSPSTAKKGKRSATQGTLWDCFQNAKSFEEGGSRAIEMNDALLYMICVDLMPLNTTNRKGFQYFVKKALPRWTPPSRPTLTKLVEEKYEKAAEYFKNMIAEVDSYSLSSDIWTETHTTRSYLGLTLHFLNKQTWEINSIQFGVRPLDQAHTAEYISKLFEELCGEWCIDKSKVVIFLTDNAENMKKAVSDTFGRHKWQPCFAHTLNLIPAECLNVIKEKGQNVERVPGLPAMLGKVKRIVSFFKRSVQAADELRRQRAASGETDLRLVQEVPTRWNSTYLMLRRFLELADVVGTVLLRHRDSPDMLTGSELRSARAVADVLAPLYQATVELSAEKVPTAGKVIPLVNLMRQTLARVNVSGDQLSENLRQFLLHGFEQRFGMIERVRPFAVATLLDPRFKKLHFTSPAAVADTLTFVSRELRSHVAAAEQAAAAAAPAPRPVQPQQDMWGIHDELVSVHSSNREEDTSGAVPVELRQFLNRPPLDRTGDPFQQWLTIKPEYPNVYKIAMQYLPLISTSVPSERLFSKAGLIVTDLRSRLSGEHLSHLLFLGSLSEKDWHAC